MQNTNPIPCANHKSNHIDMFNQYEVYHLLGILLFVWFNAFRSSRKFEYITSFDVRIFWRSGEKRKFKMLNKCFIVLRFRCAHAPRGPYLLICTSMPIKITQWIVRKMYRRQCAWMTRMPFNQTLIKKLFGSSRNWISMQTKYHFSREEREDWVPNETRTHDENEKVFVWISGDANDNQPKWKRMNKTRTDTDYEIEYFGLMPLASCEK